MPSFQFLNKRNNDQPPMYSGRAAEDQKRLDGYVKAWQAYLAELPDSIKVEGLGNDNVKVNPIRAVIETGVYFLFGDDLRFEISPNKSTEFGIDEHQENPDYLIKLNKCWRANNKKSFFHELGLSGAIHGDVFVKFIPNGAGVNFDMPRLQLIDPANMYVETEPDDYEKVTKYVIRYNVEEADKNGRQVIKTYTQEIIPEYDTDDDSEDLQFPNARIKSWKIDNYEEEWPYTPGVGFHPGGRTTRVKVGPTQDWPYSWPPIEHCNNVEIPHMFWGLPDVDESCVEVVQNIQRQMSSLSKIVTVHGSPRMYAKGVMPEMAGEIDVSADNIITLPGGGGVDPDLKVLEMLNNVQSFVEYVKEVRAQLFEMMSCPPIALGQIDTMSMSMSGINLSILYAPILQRTELKRISYGYMIDRINTKLLILMGFEDADDYEDLSIVWPEAMPGSAYLERQTLMEDVKLGLSNFTALARLGYDPEAEVEKMMKEKREMLEMESEFLSLQPGAQTVSKNGTQDPNVTDTKIRGKFQDGEDPRGGNNNPSGFGNRSGSMGAQGNSTPKNKDNPSTSRSRGGPDRDAKRRK